MSEPIELKIDARWEWAASDKNGTVWFYEDMPRYKTDAGYWFVDNGELEQAQKILTIPDLGTPADSLHQIINGKLVKYVDIPSDGEKVIVGPGGERAYSCGVLTGLGCLKCYANGTDKWASSGEWTGWSVWRRPTQEELE